MTILNSLSLVDSRIKTGVILTVLYVLSVPVQAVDYDLVLSGGRVMDPESNLDDVRNVGISDGKITAVTAEEIIGTENIDVSGLVVAPGFIDLHAHGQNDTANAYQARDGVTTALEMEMGVYPVDEWYRSREGTARLNYGATVNYLMARAAVLTGSEIPEFPAVATDPEIFNAELNPDQVVQVIELLEAGLRDGALGIGIGLEYIPGARRDEIFRVMQFAAQQTVPVYVHSRHATVIPPDSINALQELIANAAATGGSVHFVHIASSGSQHASTMLEMIDGARENGVDITTEVYPYTAASTAIGAAIFSDGWRERMEMDYGQIQWVLDGTRLDEKRFRQYRAEQPGGQVVIHFIPEETVDLAIAHPGVMIASDGGDWENNAGHPRGAGTFSRVLGHYVRDQETLDLMSALGKMTLLPARRLEAVMPGMRDKGRIKTGGDADITIFDPVTVVDRATYLDPMQPSEGIKHVLLGGEFLVRDEEPINDTLAGRPIRQ